MPHYCFSNEDGEVVEKFYKMGDAPKKITLGGVVYLRDFTAEGVGVPAKTCWPRTCYASGVHPDQAQTLRDHLSDAGVPTEVTKNGDPVYTNAKHERKALKARQMHNKSDPQS